MSNHDLVKEILLSGKKVSFHQDFYGRQWAILPRSWKFWRTRRVTLSNAEVFELKSMLQASSRRSSGRGSEGAKPAQGARLDDGPRPT